MIQTIVKGGPDPRCPGKTSTLLKFRQPDDLLHSLKTMWGPVVLRSVMDSTEQLVWCLMYMWSMLHVISVNMIFKVYLYIHIILL
jgi:hypothetical protein